MKEPNRGERFPGCPLLTGYFSKEINSRIGTVLVHKGHAFLICPLGFFDLGTDHSAFNYTMRVSDEDERDCEKLDFTKDQVADGRAWGFDYNGEYWVIFVPGIDSRLNSHEIKCATLIAYSKAK